jgi:glycosyltransferase involved in cell wall biosynthesis
VPSTLPTDVPGADAAAVRARFLPAGGHLVGHFGTYGGHVAPLLEGILADLLEGRPDRHALLLGRGGPLFADRLRRRHPDLEGRLHAPGELDAPGVALHLAACDLLLQPFPDGASSRRTSLMAGLAIGAPVLTTEGPLSEPLWRESGAVCLVEARAGSAFREAAERLLRDSALRASLGARARETYRERFAVEHTIARLRNLHPAPTPEPVSGGG